MNVKIREITAIPTLMHWRKEVMENVFGVTPSKRLLASTRRYYREHIFDGNHIAVVAEIDDTDVGCGSVCLREELPSPDNVSGHCAYLMNIYVRKEYRGRGVCHSIVEWLVEKVRESGCDKIYIETTEGMSLMCNVPLTKFDEPTEIMKSTIDKDD